MSEELEFEHYEILRQSDGSPMELGRGAMGVTYKAFDKNLRCSVALKVITADLLQDAIAAQRFLREARAAAQLRHRNVASVFHLGQRADSYFYAMEFIEGETVEALVRRAGPLECRLALDIAHQVASALVAAEKQQLVHRDIKPSNLMLVRESDDEFLVKVIDFGLVKSAALESPSSAALTAHGFVGTPYFASPEQLEHEQEDIRSDIYSLGVTLWYMLTGKPTFIGSVATVIAQHLGQPPPFHSLAGLPPEVVTVLRRMLEKDKAKRIQTSSQLRAELKSCIELVRLSSRPAALPLAAGDDFATMTLGSAQLDDFMPQPGSVLDERYRLLEDLDPGNPGRTFYAEDLMSQTRVNVRVFRSGPASETQVEQAANRVRSLAHPNVVRVFSVRREARFSFVVCEWLEGFPLVNLLRARRALTLRETLLLVRQIAPAVDDALQENLPVQLNLRDILVHFPEGITEPPAGVLMRCPLDEWPAFAIKLNALDRMEDRGPAATWVGENTGLAAGEKGPAIVQFGVLVYSLLGGKPGRFTPLASVSEAGNEVLRRCLSPQRTFPSARAFSEALDATAAAGAAPPRPAGRNAAETVRSGAGRSSGVAQAPVASGTAGASSSPSSASRASPPPVAEPPAKGRGFKAIAALLVVGALAAGGGVFWHHEASSRTRTTLATPPPSPTPNATATVAARPAMVAGQPWINSLEMRFVPMGRIQIAVFQTRVRDFEAFVRATGYDAVGGMSSAITRDGFRLNAMNWNSPGFAQTPEHAVVGVSWEDANQFCEWLTRKEHNAGLLPASYRYRLPTDLEWSAAVGLGAERGRTPEERDDKIKGVYPWGRTFPPPNGVRNYAGSESREGAPENWAVIEGFQDPFPRTAPVSAFAPNERGLCSLGGNVWEWVLDKFNRGLPWRTLRGGSWATARPEEMLSSSRRGFDPSFRSDDVGFRCVISTDGGQE